VQRLKKGGVTTWETKNNLKLLSRGGQRWGKIRGEKKRKDKKEKLPRNGFGGQKDLQKCEGGEGTSKKRNRKDTSGLKRMLIIYWKILSKKKSIAGVGRGGDINLERNPYENLERGGGGKKEAKLQRKKWRLIRGKSMFYN